MYVALPFSAFPAAGGAGVWAARLRTKISRIKIFFTTISLPRLSDRVDQIRFAAFYDFDAAPNCGSQFFRIRDRSGGCHTHTPGHCCIVDIGFVEAESDLQTLGASISCKSLTLEVHHFHVVRLV